MTTHPTKFNALGLPVPRNRLLKAYKTIKNMLPLISQQTAYSITMKCAKYIERDDCFSIVGAVTSLDKDIAIIDLTGRYRLLAVLLTD